MELIRPDGLLRFLFRNAFSLSRLPGLLLHLQWEGSANLLHPLSVYLSAALKGISDTLWQSRLRTHRTGDICDTQRHTLSRMSGRIDRLDILASDPEHWNQTSLLPSVRTIPALLSSFPLETNSEQPSEELSPRCSHNGPPDTESQ